MYRPEVKSSACFTVASLGVGIRDATGNNLDFPGGLTNQQICPKGLTVKTGARSFAAGTYRMFGYYQEQSGAWKNLPEQTFTVAPAPLVVTADRVAPDDATAETPVTGQLTLHASKCFTAAVVGVGVRDAAGNNLDFPGAVANQQVCTEDVTVKTGARSFPAGTYRMFGYYQDQAGAWYNLPEQVFTVTGSSNADPSAPVAGKKLIWREEFDGPISAAKWNKATSSAYRYGNYNPDDDKLDRIDPDKVTVTDGTAVFSATPSNFTLPNGHKAWDTGLITTEYISERFMVKTGDYAETRIRTPKEMGGLAGAVDLAPGRQRDRLLRVPPGQPGAARTDQPRHSGSEVLDRRHRREARRVGHHRRPLPRRLGRLVRQRRQGLRGQEGRRRTLVRLPDPQPLALLR
ncbi:hypothetical protein F4556_005416 [Kitasatospora gansuensis]|uniref:Uncharacterized protein n=1 Tax=Kitasatospora gansuensis TaxID=258050 RepID=A0A7W7SG61_9ACTN|nr:hypothetical protein [Kitasatospora gansuensis]MBB4949881.1 hypothetical protein [Kitasatospora gansuensis]